LKIKLGIIGISDGNGHPFSWSAIINGYNPKMMGQCGFPSISKYLALREFPKDAIQNASVTHIWCQNYNISKNIAETCCIKNIVSEPEEMIGHIDGVLLARDDAENHEKFVKPFLIAGIPVYIDKPLALTIAAARKILSLEIYRGQVFSCSALRYSNELVLPQSTINEIKGVQSIEAQVPKDWNRYSVHVIEPVLKIIGYNQKPVKIDEINSGSAKTVYIKFENDIKLAITATGKLDDPISFTVNGPSGSRCFTFLDPFSAFKSALEDFINGIVDRQPKISHETMLEVVKIIEFGSL